MPQGLDGRDLVRLLERRRWSAEDARAVLKRLEQSGLSVREFAERHGLELQRLYRWRAELSSSSPTVPPPTFVEIARPVTGRPSIEVVLRTGVVVRVPDGFDEEELRRVLAVIDGPVGSC